MSGAMGKNFWSLQGFLKSKSIQAKNVQKVCQNRLFHTTKS